MIPLRSTIPNRRFPFFTLGLIAANIWIFIVQMLSPDSGQALVTQYGMIPERFFAWALGEAAVTWEQALYPLGSYMFFHGDLLHLAGNCLYLWVFGRTIEDYFGHTGFLFFFALSGIGSGLIHLFLNWSSQAPLIGASGAIAGVMGAYFIQFPHARVVTLVPILIFIKIMELPAVLFLGFWLLLQFVSLNDVASNVAWWAHIGGFFVGIGLLLLHNAKRFDARRKNRSEKSDNIHYLN